MMSTLTGILLDVSYSMKDSIGGPVDQEGGSWARSIFRVVDQLIKNDVSPENRVFALGVGASSEPCVFDLLNTVRRTSAEIDSHHHGTKTQMLNVILSILERNGAPYVREWATLDILEKSVSDRETEMILIMLEKNTGNFTREFVHNCLPIECRVRGSSWRASLAENSGLLGYIPGVGNSLRNLVDTQAQSASKNSIREAVNKGMELIQRSGCFVVGVDSDAIVSVQEASKILRGSVGTEDLTKEQVDKLMKNVEPYIYGGTPMIEALREARNLMSESQYRHHKKVLFVLSDGEPSDGYTPPDLSYLNVHVVSCYITNSDIVDPKRLYSSEQCDWTAGAKFMFDLSSSITTQQLPRTIFVKRRWKIDFENNETKLFMQVNHPDLIDEVCAFARDVVCCQDSLSDVLASIDLDLYINKVNKYKGEVNKHKGTNSIANAAATVLHLAMKRIVGRERGYPDFFHLLEELTARFRDNEADTLAILQKVCRENDLRCKKVDTKGALEAVTEKRPVIALFCLTVSELDEFDDFYKKKRRGILSKKDLDLPRLSDRSKTRKHGAVLTSFNGKGLTLMNSRGSDNANYGFFSVENADVLGLKFVDVYWTQADLKRSEIEYFEREGPRISQMLIERLQGLQNATYECPECKQESFVREFTGRIVEATCPKCCRVFNTNDKDAHDLVLNMYLTSLVTED